ncbi:hypothetical protein [Marinobacter sp.]|uniref:hypothetical protein n=1 Tax=Marinobacter sp. TaxID=50741 RepID=UPI003A8CE65B
MKTTQSPNEERHPSSGPRTLTESEIESLKKEMKQALAEMEKYSESSGLVEKLRQRLKESDL